MALTLTQKVLFKDCDPAGIVFFPRYFEMIADATEAFFETALNCPFPELLKAHGVPTVQIEAIFTAPSRHGDILDISIGCEKLGRTSIGLTIAASCGRQPRFLAHTTLVHVDKSGQPHPWPPALRTAIKTQMKEGG